jgi:hypothetical protein
MGSKGESTIKRESTLRIRRCHALRKPGRRLKSKRLLGAVCLRRRDHAIQQDFLW